jgi:hypothetical protein
MLAAIRSVLAISCKLVTTKVEARFSGMGALTFVCGQTARVRLTLNFESADPADVQIQIVPLSVGLRAPAGFECWRSASARATDSRVVDFDFVVDFPQTVRSSSPSCCGHCDEIMTGSRPVAAVAIWLRLCGVCAPVHIVHETAGIQHIRHCPVGESRRTVHTRGCHSSETSACAYTGMGISHCGTWAALVATAAPPLSATVVVLELEPETQVDVHSSHAAQPVRFQLPPQDHVHSRTPSSIQASCCFTASASLLLCAMTSTTRASFVAHYTRTGELVRVYHTTPRGARWIAAPRNQPALFIVGNCFGQATLLTIDGAVLAEYSVGRICWGLTALWDEAAACMHVNSTSDGPCIKRTVIQLQGARVNGAFEFVHTATVHQFVGNPVLVRGWKTMTLASSGELVVTTVDGMVDPEPVVALTQDCYQVTHTTCFCEIEHPVTAMSMSNHKLLVLDRAGTRVLVFAM